MRRFLSALLFAISLLSFSPGYLQSQKASEPQRQTQGNPNVKVWVNTHSGVYHCPGTRWYGNTKQGEYMTQKEAQDKGHRPAYGKVCQ